MNRIIAVIAAAGVLSLGAAAQEKHVVVGERKAVFHTQADQGVAGTSGVRIMSMSTEAVKGAPYSAEAINESVQALADGNRITHTSKSMQYRDSEGRTRMDNSIGPVGMWVPESKEMSISNINDPVSGEHFMLDHTRKSAVKSTMRHIMASPGVAGGTKEVNVEVKHRVRSTAGVAVAGGGEGVATFNHKVAGPPGDVLIGPGPAVMMWDGEGKSEPGMEVKKESLGKRLIEGVECEGTRETLTIEAGKIGNERPIQTVTERWHSAKLQQDVLRKTTDPRFGEMTYKLTRVVQGEQPRSLFEVPSDYKVEDMNNAVFIKSRTKE